MSSISSAAWIDMLRFDKIRSKEKLKRFANCDTQLDETGDLV